MREHGLLGALTGGITAGAAGIAAAVFFRLHCRAGLQIGRQILKRKSPAWTAKKQDGEAQSLTVLFSLQETTEWSNRDSARAPPSSFSSFQEKENGCYCGGHRRRSGNDPDQDCEFIRLFQAEHLQMIEYAFGLVLMISNFSGKVNCGKNIVNKKAGRNALLLAVIYSE